MDLWIILVSSVQGKYLFCYANFLAFRIHSQSQMRPDSTIMRPKPVPMRIPGKVIPLNTGGGVKKRKFRPGTKALMEIRKYQKTTTSIIPKAPFLRLVKGIIMYVNGKTDMKIQSEAVGALQEVSTVNNSIHKV